MILNSYRSVEKTGSNALMNQAAGREFLLPGVALFRQQDLEPRAVAGLAMDNDVPAALRHDPIYRRKSQSDPLARFLRGEERFEHILKGVCTQSGSAVRHG